MTSFFILWTGQALSVLGSQVVQFALIWWLTEETGSATVLATATLVGMLPQAVLGPAIGVLVDRWNRRLILLASDAGIALATLFLAYLFYIDAIETWHIYGILFVRSIGGAFHGTTMIATTTLMVPEEHLVRVQGLNQILGGGLNIVSPPLAALLLAALSMDYILAIDVVTALFAITPLFFIRVPQPQPQTDSSNTPPPSFRTEFTEGLRYVRTQRGILTLIGMVSFVNLLAAPAFSLTPLLVSAHFGGGAMQLAWLNTAIGVGSVSGGLLLGAWGGFKRRISTALCGLIGLGLGIFILGFTPPPMLWVAVGAMGAVGIFSTFTNGPILAILQTAIDPQMQGRVFSLLNSIATGMAPLGLLVAGPVGDYLGIQVWYLAAGTMCTSMGVLGFLLPAVSRIEEHPQVAEGDGP